MKFRARTLYIRKLTFIEPTFDGPLNILIQKLIVNSFVYVLKCMHNYYIQIIYNNSTISIVFCNELYIKKYKCFIYACEFNLKLYEFKINLMILSNSNCWLLFAKAFMKQLYFYWTVFNFVKTYIFNVCLMIKF